MHFRQVKRRDFITLLGGAVVAWPLAARAQQGERVRRVGVLMGYLDNDLEAQAWVAAFHQGLQTLGWVEGRNIHSDSRWARGEDTETLQKFARELVAIDPHVISYEAVAVLRARGFKARRLEDGLPEWRAAGLAIVIGAT
jgi:putative ABC transport system substrate-binding protein